MNDPSRRPGVRAALCGLGALLLLATWAFASDGQRVESLYVERLGPLVSSALTTLTAPIPSSVAEWVEAAAIAAALAWLLSAPVRLMRSPVAQRVMLLRLLGECCAGLSLTLWLFYVSWGLAYSRPRIEKRLGWTEDFAVEPEELESLAIALVDQVNDLYLLQHQMADTTLMTGEGFDPYMLDRQIDEGWVRVTRHHGLHPSVAPSRGPTKPLISSGLFTLLGIGGFYFPYTGEANINHWAPAWQQPHTHAHEMAHQRLFASENEANFMGFLACIHSDDPLIRYSGWLFAQRQVLRTLLKVEPYLGAPQLYRRLPGVQTDVNLSRKFWTQYDGALADMSLAVNDAYLKANNVEGGVKSYGLSVRLLVRWARRCGALPTDSEAPLHGTLGQCDPFGAPAK